MFSYQPGFKGPGVQQVSTNTAAHMANVGANLRELRGIGESIQQQSNIENQATAKIKAVEQAQGFEEKMTGRSETFKTKMADKAQENIVSNLELGQKFNELNAQTEQTYRKENALLQHKNALTMQKNTIDANVKAATVQFGRNSKVAKILNQNKTAAANQVKQANLELEKIRHQYRIIESKQDAIEAQGAAKTKFTNDIAVAVAKSKGKSKVSVSDRNKILDDIKRIGGVDKVVENAIKDIDESQTFFDFDLDPQSKTDLRASMIDKLTKDPNEVAKYLFNRETYVKNFMKEYGEIDNSYLPFSKDKWTPGVKGK